MFIRLGTSIVNIYSRTPATVAMAAATLDMLSDNRTVIGLGASTPAIVENWHSLHFDRPVARMREYIDCVRLVIKGEKVNYDGTFFKIKDFKILHRPNRTRVPIFVAAINKKMISMASELADGILLYLRPFDQLKKTSTELRQATKGRAFEIACSFICSVSDKDPQTAKDRAAATLAFYIAVGKYYAEYIAKCGFHTEVDEITTEYKRTGATNAAKYVSDRMLKALVICGNREECRKSLSNFLSTGITLPILQFNPVHDTGSSFKEMLSTF
jgi:5,10-methylenetetrahydromethanopterin reductase